MKSLVTESSIKMFLGLPLIFWMLIHFVLQIDAFEGFNHCGHIYGENEIFSLGNVSSEKESAFEKFSDIHSQNTVLTAKRPSAQFPSQSSQAGFPKFTEEGLIHQKDENKFYIHEALPHGGGQPVTPHEKNSLSLAHLSHDSSSSSQVEHSPHHNAGDYSNFDCSRFFNRKHLAGFYPYFYSTEAKQTFTQKNLPLPSTKFYEGSNKKLKSHFTNLWEPRIQSSYPTEKNLELNQVGQWKEKFPEKSMQTKLSDRWKIELNYNEDDQKLLEEMLKSLDSQYFVGDKANPQNDNNLFGDLLNTQNNQEDVASQFQSSFHNHDPLKEPQGLYLPNVSRSSSLNALKYEEKIDSPKNHVKKKRKMTKISKKTSKEAKPQITKAEHKKQILKQEREDLIRILKKNFTIKPMDKEESYMLDVYPKKKRSYRTAEEENMLQKTLDIKILQFLKDANWEEDALKFKEVISNSSGDIDAVSNLISKRAQLRTFDYSQRIQWEGSEALENKIRDLIDELEDSKKIICQKFILSRMRNISIVGATFMKIISKIYSKNKRSAEFEDNQKISDYTEDIWKICFSSKKFNAKDLNSLCESLGAKSKTDIERCLSIEIDKANCGLSKILSSMRDTIVQRGDRIRLLQFAWYFALIRASVFYPEYFFISKSSKLQKNHRKFISFGILYFVKKYGEDNM
ncbi:hypothetical protein BY996DRAFT_6841495 [Phakopsora pachyrhizi]|uniref:Uncharacterized protein n=1 Tax=Phakopsora pachyrhizi TaxID=170000 RepID=A0AAV0AVZ2_PHAPC|nr:hypothetical protein BY996DRAFT_6841495 [Phakopsora pachyrhizi]CAH7673932.1 hypothetical protein PPACK8108_LOCUS8825 [Phakopsora pachyrhizi]